MLQSLAAVPYDDDGDRPWELCPPEATHSGGSSSGSSDLVTRGGCPAAFVVLEYIESSKPIEDEMACGLW